MASLILKQKSKHEPQKSLSSFYNWYILKLNSQRCYPRNQLKSQLLKLLAFHLCTMKLDHTIEIYQNHRIIHKSYNIWKRSNLNVRSQQTKKVRRRRLPSSAVVVRTKWSRIRGMNLKTHFTLVELQAIFTLKKYSFIFLLVKFSDT